jgi:CRISPR system Cascade subunit CasB
LAAFVNARVHGLQERYRANDAYAVGALARLRRAVSSAPGDDVTVWAELFEDFPPGLMGRDGQASRAERAAYAALTLYAVHQQSQPNPMHRSGGSMGSAARRLGAVLGNEEAVLRRFHALGTATSFEESLHHARGLVTQLRGAQIPLDYGRLAVDLHRLQIADRAPGVRLAWGRDYYRTHADQAGTRAEPGDPPGPTRAEQPTPTS